MTRSEINNAAIIGFAIALVGLVTFGLAAIPAVIFCIIGLRRKKHRKLAGIGLAICLLDFCILLFCIFPLTPPGSMLYPLNLAKYRLVCKNRFWLDYDKAHAEKVQSRYMLIFGSYGKIHFKAEKVGRYKGDDIIKFAEQHGWVYAGQLHLTKEDFSRYFDDWRKLAKENGDLRHAIYEVTSYIRKPLFFQDSCTVLAFDAGNIHGVPSYVMILDDGSQMAVYANHRRFPDPAYPFTLPPLFEKAQ